MEEILAKISASGKTLKGVLEGNIGAGKSSVVDIFNSIDDVKAVQESVKIWEEVGILTDFYKDPKKYGLLFQSLAFVTRLASSAQASDKKITISERSVWADRYCFAENLAEDGTISEKAIKIYQIWHRVLINGHLDKTVPDVIIYVRASPETCKRRQEIRARKSEDVIPLDYFRKLHDKHEEWLMSDDNWNPLSIGIPIYDHDSSPAPEELSPRRTKYMKNAPVFVIDIDKDYINYEDYKIYIAGKLLEAVEKYGKTDQERKEFDSMLKEKSVFPDETEIIDFVRQLFAMYNTTTSRCSADNTALPSSATQKANVT